MNKPWQVIIVLIGIFAAGGVTGSFVTLRYCKDKALNRPVPEEWTPKTLKSLDERLDLTPEQQEQIRPIVRHHMEQVSRVRNTSMADTRVIIEGMQREISSRLTTEQRTKYEQMNRELREAREKREKSDRERREKAEREKREKGEKGDKGERPPPPPGEKPGERPPPKPPGE